MTKNAKKMNILYIDLIIIIIFAYLKILKLTNDTKLTIIL